MASWPPKLGSSQDTAYPGHSGYTPDQVDIDLRESFQRNALYGFTTSELANLDAITERELK